MISTSLSGLGLPVRSNSRADDFTVRLPACFDVVRTPKDITAANFCEFVSFIRSTRAESPTTTPVAFVNGPTASFADSFVVLPDLVIFLQERQRVLARLRAITSATRRSVTVAEVVLEYEKLGADARALPHIFLYITDDGPIERSALMGLPKSCLVVSADLHPALLGRMCAFLRQQTISWSAVDAGSVAVGIATRSKPIM
jgi:hypothetical protein